MPLYEYRCNECDSMIELLQNMRGGGETLRCTVCGSEDIERVPFSTFAVSVSSGGSSASETDAPCCGMNDPCDHPKRCCEKS